MVEQILYRPLTPDVDLSLPLALYEEAGWITPADRERETVSAILKGSLLFLGAWKGEKLIGMGRAISDGGSDAYIQDVFVSAPYRNRGIGAGIVSALVERLRERGIGWIGLIGVPGTERFYRELGFRPLEGHIPMRWEGGVDGKP